MREPVRNRRRLRAAPLATFCLLALAATGAQAAAPATPAIAGVVKAGTPIDAIGEGFEGTEGPVAMPDGSLLFTENRAGRVRRVTPQGSVESFLTNPGVPNGLALDPAGRLVATLTAAPGVAVIHPPERAMTLVDEFRGKPFNRPNDLVVDRDGGVYFTDPGGQAKPGEAAAATAVYYLDSRGTLRLIDDKVGLPNGVQLSPDEKVLYVADTRGEDVLAYDVMSPGVVGQRRAFARLASPAGQAAAGADGLAVDADGRVYVATALGVQVFDAAGRALGVITLPKRPQNLAFAGRDKRDLFVVGQGAVFRIQTTSRGLPTRAK